MASSAFGFARAVETLPNYVEFGKSLVGQSKEDLDRAAKEKALAGELGLRSSELALRDEMDRRMMDYRMADLKRQRKMDDALIDYRNQGLGLDAQRVKINKQTADTQQSEVDSQNRTREAMLQPNIRRVTADARTAEAEANQADYEVQQRKEMDEYEAARRIYAENPFDPRLDESMRKQFDTHYQILANPNAGKAYQVVTQAIQNRQPPSPEARALVGSALQPFIDLGGTGQQFLGFEPAEDGSGVRIRLRNAQGKEVYMTKGRQPVDSGDEADVFSRADIGQIMGHMKNVANWQDTHPELLQDVTDHSIAMMNSTNGREYRRYKEQLQRDRLTRAQGEEKAKEHDAKTKLGRREGIIKSLTKMYDDQLGADNMLSDEEAKQFMDARNRWLSDIDTTLQGMSKDELLDIDAMDIWSRRAPSASRPQAGPSRGTQFNSPAASR
jgi:hypothetical protein